MALLRVQEGLGAPMTSDAAARAYRSIFLEEGWAHQKYYGWRLADDQPGLRVLTKKRAVFTRSLILLGRSGKEALAGAVRRAVGKAGLAEVVVHDFDGVLENAPNIAGRRFRAMTQRERLLNIATMVVDLTQDEDAILAAMSADYRRKIKKAEAQGVTIEAHSNPDEELRRAFIGAFTNFTAERGLKPADAAIVGKMYDNGDAILFVARKDGRIANFLHIYKAGDKAIFMYGVNLSKENDGAGQYLHWRAMLHLKSIGLGWYDFGGVVSFDSSDGIYNFKSKFGAIATSLGAEWMYAAPVLRMAKALAAKKIDR
jgi:hypothetical protein